MSKIAKLVQAKPVINENLVSHLEKLLESARSGEMLAIAEVIVYTANWADYGWAEWKYLMLVAY